MDGFKVHLPDTSSQGLSLTQAIRSMLATTTPERVERMALWARSNELRRPRQRVTLTSVQAGYGNRLKPMFTQTETGNQQRQISDLGVCGMDKLLGEVDSILAQIRVSGNDVFLMATARQKLKAAYDALGKEMQNDGE